MHASTSNAPEGLARFSVADFFAIKPPSFGAFGTKTCRGFAKSTFARPPGERRRERRRVRRRMRPGRAAKGGRVRLDSAWGQVQMRMNPSVLGGFWGRTFAGLRELLLHLPKQPGMETRQNLKEESQVS